MKVYCYPEKEEEFAINGSLAVDNKYGISKVLNKLRRKQARIWSLFYSMIESITEAEDLKQFEDQEIVTRLTGRQVRLYELRIPKRAKGGVLRVYFGYLDNKKRNEIMLFTAEFKKRGKANKDAIDKAESLYREIHNEGRE